MSKRASFAGAIALVELVVILALVFHIANQRASVASVEAANAVVAPANQMNIIEGTPNHDWLPKERRTNPPCDDPRPCTRDLKGTTSPDYFAGSQGWDWLNGHEGEDELHGGKGMDQFYGQEDNDRLIGDEGHDHFFGGDGNDYIDVSDGHDEPNHIEEIHGNEPKKDEHGEDTCIIDADREGAVLSECPKLRIKAIPSYSGPTTIYGTKQAKEAGKVKATLDVGIHNGVIVQGG